MKKDYSQPKLECTILITGSILTEGSPVGSDHGGSNSGGGMDAPARTLYV